MARSMISPTETLTVVITHASDSASNSQFGWHAQTHS
jgi:hypothetical protein